MALKHWWIVTLIAALALAGSRVTLAAEPVVKAVLFYSPTCGHCHQVMTVDLPPLIEKYGERLKIVGIDVTQPAGQDLYLAAQDRFNLAPDRHGVPTLVIADVVLVGSAEIPEQLPGLIEHYLEQGGVAWPDIPGLLDVLAADNPAVTPESPTPPAVLGSKPIATEPAALPALPAVVTLDIRANLARDPIANALAIGVLAFMIVSVGGVTWRLRQPIEPVPARRPDRAIPVLCVVGLGVAAYLAYVEMTQVSAVCGPIGDCNTVQQSEYARLFGVLPIGVLGLIGYAAIAIAWWIERQNRPPFDRLAALAQVSMTFGGTLFSIYLMFLEPFVIGATCAWCLTSAILMTALLFLTVTPQRWALIRGVLPGRNPTKSL